MKKNIINGIIQEVSESRIFKVMLYTFGTLVVASFIFQAGMIVGFSKASFARDWGENYENNFGRRGTFSQILGLQMPAPNAHGATGKIIQSDYSKILLEDKDGTEKVVIINENTKIRKMNKEAERSDLTLDASIVIIGNPNAQGQIEAKLIRILNTPSNTDTDDGIDNE